MKMKRWEEKTLYSIKTRIPSRVTPAKLSLWSLLNLILPPFLSICLQRIRCRDFLFILWSCDFYILCVLFKKNSARAPKTNKADNYLTSNCLWNWWLGRDWVRSSIFIQRRCWRQTFATLSVIPPAATSFSNARANKARRIPALRRRLILFLTSVFFTWPTYLSCLPRCPLKPSCKLFQMCALPFTCTRPISLSVRTKPSINCLC